MIHPLEEKTAVAAAQAQKRCGAPIWGHTEAGTMGMELLDILALIPSLPSKISSARISEISSVLFSTVARAFRSKSG